MVDVKMSAEMRAKGLLQLDQVHTLRERIAQNNQGLIKAKALIDKALGKPEFEDQLIQLRTAVMQLEFEIEVFEHKIASLSVGVSESGLADLL